MRYGYTLLNFGEVRNLGGFFENDTKVDVLAYPSRKFPGHAGIVADIGDVRVTAHNATTPELMMLQKELA